MALVMSQFKSHANPTTRIEDFRLVLEADHSNPLRRRILQNVFRTTTIQTFVEQIISTDKP